MAKEIDITGQTFGRLTAVVRVRSSKRNPVWLFKCRCGKSKSILKADVKKGHTHSCGCIKREQTIDQLHKLHQNQITHGLWNTRIYRTWAHMVDRCRNKNHPNYDRYGGRGITVCERWKYVENFHSDMGDHPKGLTLGRINNDKGYEPDNCRWETHQKQMQNTSRNKLTKHEVNRIREFRWAGIDGPELARLFGVTASHIYGICKNESWCHAMNDKTTIREDGNG